MITISLNNKIVSKSKDLRGIMEYNRKFPLQKVDIFDMNPGASFRAYFSNGAVCEGIFASYNVCNSWFSRILKET